MKSVEFCYWLQGFFEIHGKEHSTSTTSLGLNEKQVECIRSHLAMVFVHEIDKMYPAEEFAKLDAAHQGLHIPVYAPNAPTVGDVKYRC